MSEEELIKMMRTALANIRSEAVKQKPNPDKIFEIAEDAIRKSAGY